MSIGRRLNVLEKRSGVAWLKPVVLVLRNEDEDEEQAIAAELARRGCKRDDCAIIVVTFVKSKHMEHADGH